MRIWLALPMLMACGGSDGGGSNGDGGVVGAPGPYFETSMFWNLDVSAVTPAANSAAIISALRDAGGWGNGDLMQLDFSFDILAAGADAPLRTFEPTADFYDPDCDNVAMPVPVGGNVEGETGYACANDGDCHLLVYQPSTSKLYEMWRANITDKFYGGCLAVWDTKKVYPASLRGEQCTSADAAGFPISAMLFNADDVAAGHIDHAIRLILPNDRIAPSFVPPATHGTDTTGGPNAPSYGVHLRLKSTFDVDALPSEGAKVVARAMQRYGMYHSDGGEIALTAQSDRYTTAKWDGLLDAHDLGSLRVEDFDVIDHGAPVPVTQDCVR
ncbi:MAG: hypothetical protein NT062_18795 [Proteobacteria bacterium]|nr:hypothetical protein [Pseudomonadota bacterium]